MRQLYNEKGESKDALSRSVRPSLIVCKQCEMPWNYHIKCQSRLLVNENEKINLKVEEKVVVTDESNIENNQEECDSKVKLSIQKWIPSPCFTWCKHFRRNVSCVKKRR